MKASGNSNSVSSFRPSVAGFSLPTYCCCCCCTPTTTTTTTTRSLTHRRLRSTSHHSSLSPLPHSALFCALTSLVSTRRRLQHSSAHQFPRRPTGRPTDPVIGSLLTHYRAPRFLSSRSPPPLLPPQPPRSRTYTSSPPTYTPTRLFLLVAPPTSTPPLPHPLALASRLLTSARARQLCSRSRGPAAAIRSRATPTRIPQTLALWTSPPLPSNLLLRLLSLAFSHTTVDISQTASLIQRSRG